MKIEQYFYESTFAKGSSFLPWRSLIGWSGPAGGQNFVKSRMKHFCGNAERAVFSQSRERVGDFDIFSRVALGGGVDVNAMSEDGTRDGV